MVLRIGTQCSMNLGQAVAVCLYELTPTSPASRPDKRQGAAAGDLDRYATLLAEILAQSGYVHSTGADAKIRRFGPPPRSLRARLRSLAGHVPPDPMEAIARPRVISLVVGTTSLGIANSSTPCDRSNTARARSASNLRPVP